MTYSLQLLTLSIITLSPLFIKQNIKTLSSISILGLLINLIFYHDELTDLKKDNSIITFFNLIFNNFESIYLLYFIIIIISFIVRTHLIQELNDINSTNYKKELLILLIFIITYIGILQPIELYLFPLEFVSEEINQQLINPMMIFHPIILYIAYSYILVLSLSYLSLLKVSSVKRFFYEHKRFLSHIVYLLGTSLMFSILWSWDINTLSWTWDPIEGLLMFIFILSVLILHFLYFYRNFNKFINIKNIIFIIFWISPIMSLLLVRTGVLQSVHSFSESENYIFLIFVLLMFIIYIIQVSFMEYRSFNTIMAKSLLFSVTILLFLITLILFLVHALHPNMVGFKLEPEDFESIVLLPLLIFTCFIMLIIPLLINSINNIKYISYIIILYISVYYTYNLSYIVYTSVSTIIISKLLKSKNFRIIHAMILGGLLYITIALCIKHEEEIAITVGQCLESEGYKLILYKLQTCKQEPYIYNIAQILYYNNKNTENIQLIIRNTENINISKSRIYNCILGHSDHTIKLIINKNQQFLNIKQYYTPHIITIITIITLFKTIKKQHNNNINKEFIAQW